jgi:outer membrane lipoprotein SlyB
MRRLALGVIVAAALAGCGSSDEGTQAAGPSGQLAKLVVTVDDDGAKGAAKPRELRVDCAKPTDSRACGAAAGVSAADLRKTAEDVACTQIYGGPEEASIKGTIRGDAVEASFSRTDGCEISRWKRVEPLLAEVR